MSDIENAQPGATAAAATEVQAPPEQAQNTGSDSAEEQTQPQEKPRDDKGRFVPQERVNEITKARREAERERDYYRQQVEQFQRAQQQPAHSDGPPKLEDYDDFNQFNAANAAYIESRIQSQIGQYAGQQQFQSRQVQVLTEFDARASAYEAQNPGFSDRFENLVRAIPPSWEVAEAIATSEHGPAIADHLANHMDEADRIFRLPPHLAAIQIGRIEERLSRQQQKPVSSAPPVPPAVGGGSQLVKKDPSQMSDAEWYHSERAKERSK